jgi:hypothetical protein
LVSLACDKAKEHGYPHELWTTRLLARHAREHGPTSGHECLARLVQGTVCKILGQEEIKPHKVRYYLERRDPEFEQKMAEVLCVYREVQVLKRAAATSRKAIKRVAIAGRARAAGADEARAQYPPRQRAGARQSHTRARRRSGRKRDSRVRHAASARTRRMATETLARSR